ncbi:MAG: hypothetical protein WA908_04205 [Pontixanthobacter sp.]
MIRSARLMLFAPALLLGLAGCNDDPEPAPVADADVEAPSGAQGDVMEGSISDDMLPLDTLTSTAPQAGEDGEDDADSENEAETEEDSEAAAE